MFLGDILPGKNEWEKSSYSTGTMAKDLKPWNTLVLVVTVLPSPESDVDMPFLLGNSKWKRNHRLTGTRIIGFLSTLPGVVLGIIKKKNTKQ